MGKVPKSEKEYEARLAAAEEMLRYAEAGSAQWAADLAEWRRRAAPYTQDPGPMEEGRALVAEIDGIHRAGEFITRYWEAIAAEMALVNKWEPY